MIPNQPSDAEQRAAMSDMVRATGNTLAELTAKDMALRELASRQLSRRHLIPFILRFKPSYNAGWVHKDICSRLEQFSQDVADGKSPRLMLFMPPRHGKSEIVSRNFPAWHLGQYPQHEFIATSYSSGLALKFSRHVRSLLREPGYAELFPNCQLDPDTQALEAWATTQGGGYMAAGVSGPLTGNGMHIGVIDDPVKNREEADSETIRETIKEWYTSTFYTRLAPGGGVLIVLTRWHHDDLAGWLLDEAKHGGDKWEVVVYPAIAEEDEKYRRKGEPLHPARYNAEALARIENVLGDRDWSSLYQQRPTAAEGAFFQSSWMRTYDVAPPLDDMSIYATWDLAIGKRSDNDRTAGLVFGVDREDNIYVLDLIVGRWDAAEICDKVLDSWRKWQPQRVGIERGHIYMTLGPLLEKRIAERKDWSFPYDPEGLRPGKNDKQARAAPIQGRMRMGKVLFPADAVWLTEMRHELLTFPSGKHDDIVDALAWAGQMLMLYSVAPVRKAKPASWRDKLPELMRKNYPGSSHMGA